MTDVAQRTSKYGLKIGDPAIRSVGPITFGPDNILFVADNREAKIFALDVADTASISAAPVSLDQLDTRLAAYLGCRREDLAIRDMAVHSGSQAVYFSVMRGQGAAGLPVIVRIAPDGTISDVPLRGLPFAEAAIEDAPSDDDPRKEVRLAGKHEPAEEMTIPDGRVIRLARDGLRTVTVTDLKYLNGLLVVAGASNEEFSSTLRRIPFPFTREQRTNSLEIFHVSHGKYETHSPIRSFVPSSAGILASYTCTPVVYFSLKELSADGQVKGRTVAELGSVNTPLDMVAFQRDGEDYVLVSNSHHGLMKIAVRDVETQEALTQPKAPLGVPRATLPQQGVSRMAVVGDSVLMMQADDNGDLHLRPYSCATI
jgi:hypothetical protein